MDVPARSFGQPVTDQRRLMGCLIVLDETNVQIIRHGGFDLIRNLRNSVARGARNTCR